jgi:hypothetical protein
MEVTKHLSVLANISDKEKSLIRLTIGCCLDWMREQETASSQQK